jgi:hypothetical protein
MATALEPSAAAAELAQTLGQMSETVPVVVDGKPRDVTVSPFRLRQFAHVLKCVQRLRDAGAIEAHTLKKAVKDISEAESAEQATGRFDMLKMILQGGDEIINILQVAVGGQLQAQALDKLDLVSAARLASAVFSVNLDFFYQNRATIQAALAPAVKAVEKVVDEGVEALGQPPSTDSSELGTP